MLSQIRKSKLRVAVLLAVIFIPAIAFGQESEQQNRVAAFKLAVQQSMAGLLEEAKAKGWTVVDMKNEWKVIYPFEKK